MLGKNGNENKWMQKMDEEEEEEEWEAFKWIPFQNENWSVKVNNAFFF